MNTNTNTTKAEQKAARQAANRAKAEHLRAMVREGRIAEAKAEADALGVTWLALVTNYADALAAKAERAEAKAAEKAAQAVEAAPVAVVAAPVAAPAQADDVAAIVTAMLAKGATPAQVADVLLGMTPQVVAAPVAAPAPVAGDDMPTLVVLPPLSQALAGLAARIARRTGDVIAAGDAAVAAVAAQEAAQAAAWCEAAAQADPERAGDLRKRGAYYAKAAATLRTAAKA